jgi:hypothetical protein
MAKRQKRPMTAREASELFDQFRNAEPLTTREWVAKLEELTDSIEDKRTRRFALFIACDTGAELTERIGKADMDGAAAALHCMECIDSYVERLDTLKTLAKASAFRLRMALMLRPDYEDACEAAKALRPDGSRPKDVTQ